MEEVVLVLCAPEGHKQVEDAIWSIRMRPHVFLLAGQNDRKRCLARKKKKRPSHLAVPSLFMTHGFVCLSSLRSVPQLLPEGLLLWPRLLRQHGGGEHGGEGGEDEVGGDPVSFLHPALPLHELPGAPGQVRSCSRHTGALNRH